MGLTYRVPQPDELVAFSRPVWRGFGDPAPGPDAIADEEMLWEPERSIGALDGDEWVGGTGTFTMDLTLPGGAVVPAAGVTMVGVAATHRRRGILTELMARQLGDVAAGPEPVAILTASESLIYGRYGFGLATQGVALSIEPTRAALRDDAPPPPPGRLQQVTIDEARVALPEAYERIRARRPGSVARSHAWWETHVFLDRESHREGGSGLYVLVHRDAAGAVDGWATYRAYESWVDRLPTSTLRVEGLEAVDDAVHLALWRGLFDHDLYRLIEVRHAPLDDPLRWALRDPRRLLASSLSDWLWLRLLDIPGALGRRRWGGEGHLTVEVVDAFRPASGGRFLIEADASGAGQVTRTDRPAELVLGTEELGAVALGGVAPSALGRVGRIDERGPGALAVADTLFRSALAPHCATMF